MIEFFYRRVLEKTDPFEPRTRQELENRMIAAFVAVHEGQAHLTPEEAISVIAREMSHDQPPVIGREKTIRQILGEAKQTP